MHKKWKNAVGMAGNLLATRENNESSSGPPSSPELFKSLHLKHIIIIIIKRICYKFEEHIKILMRGGIGLLIYDL
jgi:hypothetical protein